MRAGGQHKPFKANRKAHTLAGIRRLLHGDSPLDDPRILHTRAHTHTRARVRSSPPSVFREPLDDPSGFRFDRTKSNRSESSRWLFCSAFRLFGLTSGQTACRTACNCPRSGHDGGAAQHLHQLHSRHGPPGLAVRQPSSTAGVDSLTSGQSSSTI